MSDSKDRICITRMMKNVRYIEHIAAHLLQDKNLYDMISPKNLTRMHTVSNPDKIIKNPKLARLLKKIKIPSIKYTVSEPLFCGTLYFVQLIFNTPNGTYFISNADMRTSINYAKLAAVQISRYASQYGYNSVYVSSKIIRYSVTLQSDKKYVDNNRDANYNLRNWLKEIIAENNLPTNSSLVILNPASQGITNASAPTSGMWNVGGYHSYAYVPYCFCNVYGQNLSVYDDKNYFAQVLSHEMAEMVADPRADMENPEVCDPCSCNCENLWLDFFKRSQFIGGSQTLPAPFDYDFYINSMVRPTCLDAKTHCIVPGVDPKQACVYPQLTSVISAQNFAAIIDILFGIINDGGIYRTPDGKFHKVPPMDPRDPVIPMDGAIRQTEMILTGISLLAFALRTDDKKEQAISWRQAMCYLRDGVENLSFMNKAIGQRKSKKTRTKENNM